jgi:hypothetical protein
MRFPMGSQKFEFFLMVPAAGIEPATFAKLIGP